MPQAFSMRFRSGTLRTLQTSSCLDCSKFTTPELCQTIFASIFRFCPGVIVEGVDDSLITWLLLMICCPQLARSPYLVAKLIEVLFVISSGSPSSRDPLHVHLMEHPLYEIYLPSCLMKFYTGKLFHCVLYMVWYIRNKFFLFRCGVDWSKF